VELGGHIVGVVGWDRSPETVACHHQADRQASSKTILEVALALPGLKHRVDVFGTQSARAEYAAAIRRYNRLVHEHNAALEDCVRQPAQTGD
jgi:hypothetical protein